MLDEIWCKQRMFIFTTTNLSIWTKFNRMFMSYWLYMGYTCLNYTSTEPNIMIRYPEVNESIIRYLKTYFGYNPMCPLGCSYDVNEGACKSESNYYDKYTNSICEPYIIITCPYNEYINLPTKCYEDIIPYDMSIQYPLRLKYKYDKIKCKYSSIGNCEIKRLIQECCKD